jgi:hypothetical protein
MMLAIIAWCDTLLAAYRQASGTAEDAPLRIAWLSTDTGQLDTDADDVPLPVRWSGRLLMARAVLDKPAWDALISALPHDQEGLREHVAALLDGVSGTLRALNGIMS